MQAHYYYYYCLASLLLTLFDLHLAEISVFTGKWFTGNMWLLQMGIKVVRTEHCSLALSISSANSYGSKIVTTRTRSHNRL